MGKGKGVACAQPVAGLHEFDRQTWLRFSEKQLRRVLRVAGPLDQAAALEMIEELLDNFKSGQDVYSLKELNGRFRLMLGEMLMREADSSTAVRLLAHPHVDKDKACELLGEAVEDSETLPVDRSRYRHFLAQLLFDQGDTEEALALLEQDLHDKRVLPARHALARRKIEVLTEYSPPSGWVEQLLPSAIGEMPEVLAEAEVLSEQGIDSHEGQRAASNLGLYLSRHGFTDEALRLSLRVLELGGSASPQKQFAAGLAYARALFEDGQPDQAALAFRALVEESSTPLMREVALHNFSEMLDDCEQPQHSIRLTREMRDRGDQQSFTEAHSLLLAKLVSAGDYRSALHEMESGSGRDQMSPLDRRHEVMRSIIDSSGDASLRSSLRRSLSLSFSDAGDPDTASRLLQEDLRDPDIQDRDIELTQACLNNL